MPSWLPPAPPKVASDPPGPPVGPPPLPPVANVVSNAPATGHQDPVTQGRAANAGTSEAPPPPATRQTGDPRVPLQSKTPAIPTAAAVEAARRPHGGAADSGREEGHNHQHQLKKTDLPGPPHEEVDRGAGHDRGAWRPRTLPAPHGVAFDGVAETVIDVAALGALHVEGGLG